MTRCTERMTREQSRRPTPGGGFSLLELVVVMAVMAVLSVVAIPALLWLGPARVGTAARVTTQMLTYAREHAMNTGTPCWVVFDTTGEMFSVLTEIRGSPGRAGAVAMNDPATGRALVQAFGSGEFPGVGIASSDFDGWHEVGFDHLGRPLNHTGGAPRFAGIGDARHRVRVHGGGGHGERRVCAPLAGRGGGGGRGGAGVGRDRPGRGVIGGEGNA